MHADTPLNLPEIYTRYASMMVRHPDLLRVESEETGEMCEIRVRGHHGDHGLLIGASGRNVKAMQFILAEIGKRDRRAVRVRVFTPWVGEAQPPQRFEPRSGWQREDDERLAGAAAELLGHLRGSEEVVEAIADPKGDRTALRWKCWYVPSTELEDAIYTIFRAIGKTQGRLISFHAVPQTQSPVRA